MSFQSQIANRRSRTGFTLLELIITLSVLSILVMGTIPLAQNAVKRQKELRLRETLRDIRNAIDEFKRDTIGSCPLGALSNQTANLPGGGSNIPADPRSRVVIDDCTIFDTENLDRYPPSLEILVEGVKVKQRGGINAGGGGLGNDKTTVVFTENDASDEKKKVYLREMPVDPMTGESNWILRSSYQTADAGNWDDINVFDVRSTSEEKAFNGEKYSAW
jgi:general secretion pathway protein G